MRRIAVINQKGGVGKTTTCTNLGAALARLGRRVLLVDMDPQANLTMHLAVESLPETPSIYTVLLGETKVEEAVQPTSTEGLFLIPSNIDLSGAELELASAIGRETILKDALDEWQSRTAGSDENYDYLIFDCAPSLGLLTINALTATSEVVITLQTEFFALQGMSKLIEIVGLLKRRLNPTLEVSGILPCLYDSRLKLAREVLAEIRSYFPEQVLPYPIRNNIKLAEAPSYGQTIFEYAADSNGAEDHLRLARSIIEQESQRAPQVAARYAEPEQASEDTAKKEGASGDDPALNKPGTGEASAKAGRAAKSKDGGKPTSTKNDGTKTGQASQGSKATGKEANCDTRQDGPDHKVTSHQKVRTWESPEVGDVELEPRPRAITRSPESDKASSKPDELPPLPPDAFEMTGYPSL